jgi:cell wall-associated NlpC family hydrolase
MMTRALALCLVLSANAWALPPGKAKKAVAAAKELVGKTYQLGGRLRGEEGIDCQGVVFYALERIAGCGWKSFSVNPTESVRFKELGEGVPGLFPVPTEELDPSLLQPGDVVMLLAPVENPAEPAMVTLSGERLWVWHVGLAVGDGKWINADPFTAQVTEGDLVQYLREHEYPSIAVTRMAKGPKPRRCRQNAPMGASAKRAAVTVIGSGPKP